MFENRKRPSLKKSPKHCFLLLIGAGLLLIIVILTSPQETSAYAGKGVHAQIPYKAYQGFPLVDWFVIYPGAPAWNVAFSIEHGEYDEDEVDVVWDCTTAEACNTLNHFWSPDQGPWTRVKRGATTCLDDDAVQQDDCYNNSLYKAVFLTARAIAIYRSGSTIGYNRSLAYDSLGRVAHLLQDQSVPAHAHEDLHPTKDYYEKAMDDGGDNHFYWTGDDGYVTGALPVGASTPVGLIDIPPDVCQKFASDPEWRTIWGKAEWQATLSNPGLAVDPPCPTCGPMLYDIYGPIDPCSNTYGVGLAKIVYLMYTTNQYADWFDSTDVYGDSYVWYFPEWIDYSEFEELFPADRFPDYRVQGHYLYRYAMRATATLFKVFEEMVKPTLMVNSLDDPGSGSCDSTECTLREAIAMAAPYARINFEEDMAGDSITLQSPLLIDKHLIIDGASLTPHVEISGNNSVRVFYVTPGVNVAILGLNIINGSADKGGGIYNAGTLTISDSTFSGNNAISYNCGGGGIYNFQAMLIVTDSAFSGNNAVSNNCVGGGGIYNELGTLTVTNSTFSDNSANIEGGGIINGNGTLKVTNSTFSGNLAYNASSIRSTGTLNLSNSILANSVAGGECTVTGNFTNNTNLVEDGTCSASLSGDPLLGPLQDNGGPTQTMAIGGDSPAYNAGDNGVCPATDQRGMPRPFGAGCDIGAFENQGSFIYLPLVNRGQ